jgi:hypothetical protein
MTLGLVEERKEIKANMALTSKELLIEHKEMFRKEIALIREEL